MGNRLRLAAAIVLLLLAAGYAYYLFVPRERPEPAGPETIVHAQVLADGSVTIGSERFADPDKLKVKIAQLQQAHPHTSFNLHAAPDMNFGPMGKAALLFQQSGAYKVVFVTAPKKAPPERVSPPQKLPQGAQSPPDVQPGAPQATPN